MPTSADLAYVSDLPQPVTALVGQGTYLASGGSVAYVSGLSFRVSPGIAYFGFVQTPFVLTNLTLGAANGSNPRLDAIVVDNTGTVSVVAGTAAANPALPDLDPVTQIALTYILVPTLASSLSITTLDIYKENTEWTSSVSGASVVASSTNNPYAGTKDIEFTAAAAGDYARLTGAAAISLDTAKQLVLQIRSKATFPNPKSILVTWYLAGVKIGQSVSIANNAFGFVSSTIASYQQLVLPITAFLIPAGATVDRLEFKINGGGGTVGFYIDNVVLESVSTVLTPPPIALKESDLPLPAWVALTDGATITWDVSGKREAKAFVTLGGNRILAIVGAKNGSAGIIKVIQGSGGQGLTLPTGSTIVGGGGTTAPLSAGAGAVDVLAWECLGTTFLWTYGKAFA